MMHTPRGKFTFLSFSCFLASRYFYYSTLFLRGASYTPDRFQRVKFISRRAGIPQSLNDLPDRRGESIFIGDVPFAGTNGTRDNENPGERGSPVFAGVAAKLFPRH